MTPGRRAGGPEEGGKKGRGMRNILGDDVAFVRSLEPETKERALRGDGSDGGRTDARTESERGINSRVVKIPDAAAANSAPLSPSLPFSLARNVE